MKNILFFFLSPKYISNTTHYIIFLSLIFKNNFLLHSLLPLCLSNAIFISITMLFIFEKFNTKKLKNKIKSTDNIEKINDYIYLFKLVVILIHFLIPLLIFYLNYHKERKEFSNTIISMFVSVIVLFVYSLFIDKEQYSDVNLNGKDIIYIISLYLLLIFVLTVFYFM